MQSGDDIAGATVEQARWCLTLLGKIHGTMLQKGVANYSWHRRESPLSQTVLQQLISGSVGRYRDLLAAEEIDICARLVSSYDAYKKQ
jgi:hypothetical protein